MVTQRQPGSVERITRMEYCRHPIIGPRAEAAGVVERRLALFALAAGEFPPSRT